MQLNIASLSELWPQQSPINVTASESVHVRELKLVLSGYDAPLRGKLVDAPHGHGFEFKVEAGCPASLTLEPFGITAKLLKLHFHAKSEHTVEGDRADMEVHFVHEIERPGDGSRNVVLGVLFHLKDRSKSVPALKMLSDNLTPHGSADGRFAFVDPVLELPTERFIPAANTKFFRYEGSLTTPGYTEVVTWVVSRDPLPVPKDEISDLVEKITHDYRAVQPLNRRYVLRNF